MNLTDKRIRIAKKKHKLLTRKLGLPGLYYILKRDGSTQKFITLATFEYAEQTFDRARHSGMIEFAASTAEVFERNDVERTMAQIGVIATHIAHVQPSGVSLMWEIEDGDGMQPFFSDDTYKFFIQQIGDTFAPEGNE